MRHIYENKGYAYTSVKTIYGVVEYRRHKYVRKNEDEINEIIYPLDEKLKMNYLGKLNSSFLILWKFRKSGKSSVFRGALYS